MRIGLYEYVTAELADAPTSLRAEGGAMLAALCEDFARIPGFRVSVFQSEPRTQRGGVSGMANASFQAFVRQTDWTLVIAPEFDDILHTRCRWVVEAGGALLGPSPDAISLAADKWRLGQHLHAYGVRTPPSVMYDPPVLPPPVWRTVVVKPRWGAGSQATYRIDLLHEAAKYAQLANDPEWCGAALVQPFLAGQPASVAFLLGPRQRVPLRPAAQLISAEGRCRYLGGRLPLPEALAARAVQLATRALETMPDLCGYVGVDLVLGDDPRGSADAVLEINPRMTTSYVGLRQLARTNLAEAMLRIARGEASVAVEWRPGRVEFQAEGTFTRYP